MSKFTTLALAGNLVLVEGTDVRGVLGQTTVDATEYNELARRQQIESAHAEFDGAIEEFYSVLTTAAAKFEAAHQVEIDPLLYIVEQEAVEGQAHKAQVTRLLQPGTVILRAIEQGKTDRLVWVNEQLVLTAAPVTPVPADEQVDDETAVADPAPVTDQA